MQKAKEIVSRILEKRAVKNIYFVGCGGSLVGFWAAKYFLSREAKQLREGYMNANEFVYATPPDVGAETVVILASQRGDTPETVAACKLANELGAATIGLTFKVPSPLSETAQDVRLYEFGPESII